jgi:predicted MPP superfamily phosphohydrolase
MRSERALARHPRFERSVRDFRGPHLVEHEVRVPNLDPSHDGLRVAHLSDLHVGLLTSTNKIRRAVRRAAHARPDLTVLTGDYLCYSPKFLGLLGELVAEIEGPAVAVLGNHDYWTDGEGVRQVFERAYVHVLRNQHSTVHLKGAPLEIVGIDDAVTAQADPVRAFRGLHAREGRSRLVLTHVPSIADIAAQYGPSMMLAGHTHGGHVNIPRITAGIARRLGNRYLAGFYEVGDSLLYVNRGVGSSSVPFRANAPSEVALLTLRASDCAARPRSAASSG